MKALFITNSKTDFLKKYFWYFLKQNMLIFNQYNFFKN